MSIERKMERVGEVLEGLAQDLKNFHSEASESYVRSDQFQDLLERTLRQAADERNDEKRRIYRLFLKEQLRCLASRMTNKGGSCARLMKCGETTFAS